jgi:hypothetical protein
LAFAVVVFPPEGDPVPRSTGLAFLQAAALRAAPVCTDGFRNNSYVIHGDPDHSIRIATDRVVSDALYAKRGASVRVRLQRSEFSGFQAEVELQRVLGHYHFH